MTTHAVRTNRLAMISFASGLLALLCIAGMLIAMSLAPTDYDLVGTLTSGVLLPLRDLSVLVALVTGILALREIKQKKGAERGKTLAWLGIAIGMGWIVFFILVAVAFWLLLLASSVPEGSNSLPPVLFLAIILVSDRHKVELEKVTGYRRRVRRPSPSSASLWLKE